MRVITGSARGKKLKSPDGMNTRPTTDRVKESVFNIIQSYLPAEKVLDLFAGSGAMGIEALSRGSRYAVFADTDSAAINVIKQNLEGCRFSEKAQVLKLDAEEYLSRCQEKFDIIFLDPPYNCGYLNKVIKKLLSLDILTENGIIVAESEFGGESVELDSVDCIKTAKYGKTVVSVFKSAHNKA